MGQTACIAEPSEISEKDRSAVFAGAPPSVAAVAAAIRDGRITNVVLAVGAGISVAAGISDFRSPGTGLYDNLQKYDLPTPESIFTLDYFREKPEPFCTLARELLPGKHRPTLTHFFCKLLERKGLLLRVFTQNIDGLERLAGVLPEKIVESHGHFLDAHCVDCGRRYSVLRWKQQVENATIPRCDAQLDVPPPPLPPTEEECILLAEKLSAIKARKDSVMKGNTSFDAITSVFLEEARLKAELQQAEQAVAEAPNKLADWNASPKVVTCGALVKPDIVFFGESLPTRFKYFLPRDGRRANLLIVMGTSLNVMPFAGILGKVGPLCPRLLINREPVGLHNQDDPPMLFGNIGFRMHEDMNYRDVYVQANCDTGVRQLCQMLGWSEELESLIEGYVHQNDTFTTLASMQFTEEKWTSEMDELAGQLFDAMIALCDEGSKGSPRTCTTLRRCNFVEAQQRLLTDGTELIVGLDDGENEAGIGRENFCKMLGAAFEALGARSFCATISQQIAVLKRSVVPSLPESARAPASHGMRSRGSIAEPANCFIGSRREPSANTNRCRGKQPRKVQPASAFQAAGALTVGTGKVAKVTPSQHLVRPSSKALPVRAGPS